MKPVKLLAAAVLATVVALGMTAVALAQSDDDKVVLTVGIPETYDSFNPMVGVEVPDFDVWNMQYATLTDKAADDFSTIPGLAESWEGSEDGKTYTYTLRDGLEWSDGTPLTADDIAYTINRAREEQWSTNYLSTVQNITAKAIDERTVELTSSVNDPKLPIMDVYILPKHIWEKYDAKAITTYDGVNDVGSGPFVLKETKRGQFWSLKANPKYWGGAPAVDEVIFRVFNNPDAMVAALKAGEIDVAHDIPNNSVEDLRNTPGIVVVVGEQGGFDEIALNGGDGLKKPHPALLDPDVRLAVAHAIDKQTLVDRVLVGLGRPATTISPSASPAWIPEVPEDEQIAFDLEEANRLLDEGGYEDTDGDGIREMPGGGEPLNFTYLVNTESQSAGPVADFMTGWLKEIGIAVTQKPMDENRLYTEIGNGEYDLFQWGWTPYVDPDPMLSYFQCSDIAQEKDASYNNDANLCDPEYDKLYKQQNVELDPDKRQQLVHEMLTRFYKTGVYNTLWYEGDLQAYRTDAFEGWLRQPAGTGPVIFSNTSPSYAAVTPVSSTSDGGGGMSTGAIVGIVAAAIAGAALIFYFVRRRGTAEERE
ncbi:MAG: ABC transporter substrate-binding protein [Gaiellaceae bacterium]